MRLSLVSKMQESLHAVNISSAQEQETHRLAALVTGADAISSNVDDKTLHELYLW